MTQQPLPTPALEAAARVRRELREALIAFEGALASPVGDREPWRADVADALGISARTIEHLKARFVEDGMDAALGRKPRSGQRDITFDGAFDARVTALACSAPPAGRARWTVRLLADKLVELQIVPSVSVMTVQRALKKTSCVLT